MSAPLPESLLAEYEALAARSVAGEALPHIDHAAHVLALVREVHRVQRDFAVLRYDHDEDLAVIHALAAEVGQLRAAPSLLTDHCSLLTAPASSR